MMNRFAGALPTGLGRKALWIAVTAIVIMLAWAQITLGDGRTYFEIDPDGMMRPDGTIQQRVMGHPPINYTSKRTHDGAYLILRNGVPLITVSAQKNQYIVSDPNGTGQPVIKLDQSGGQKGAPVKLRAPAP